MAPDKLVPDDPRMERHDVKLNGKTYSYMLGNPQGAPAATVILIHGFPDLGFGWRYQVPFLLSLGLRVVVPDSLGYGRTDAPDDPAAYAHKLLAADVAALAAHVAPAEQIILGGHDWGGALVWRVALWHPALLRGVFSVCTPYNAPSKEYTDLAVAVASGRLPMFGYQLQFRGPEVEERVRGEAALRLFLNAMYAGRGPGGEAGFSPECGVLFDELPRLGPSPLVAAAELDYYTAEYARHGMRGPLNWYRAREANFEDERGLVEGGGPGKFKMPALFITATRDSVLKPELSRGMERHFEKLTRREVEASHWALWQAPGEVNEHLKLWIEGVLGRGQPSASL